MPVAMPQALRPIILRVAAAYSVVTLGLLVVQHIVQLPTALFLGAFTVVVVAAGFTAARIYMHRYRFVRLRAWRAVAFGLDAGIVTGTSVGLVEIVLLWGWGRSSTFPLLLSCDSVLLDLLRAAGISLVVCLLLAGLGAVAAYVATRPHSQMV